MNSLSLEHLGFERDERFLFRDLNFSAQPGDIVQVVGPNGAGKTSLLRVIVGLLRESEGEIKWLDTGENSISSDLHFSLLYLGHETGVNYAMSAIENLRWYFGLNGLKRSSASDVQEAEIPDDILLSALDSVGLSGYANVVCHEMSAGQRRRVALARLFVSKASLWVLDEPFTAIDVAGVKKLEEQMQEHCANGGIVLFTTHQASSLQNIRSLDLSHFINLTTDEYVAETRF